MTGGPLNFGVEKLESAVHKNVAIKVQGGQLVGANSVILAVNSPLLDDVITRQQRSIVEISRWEKGSDTSSYCMVFCPVLYFDRSKPGKTAPPAPQRGCNPTKGVQPHTPTRISPHNFTLSFTDHPLSYETVYQFTRALYAGHVQLDDTNFSETHILATVLQVGTFTFGFFLLSVSS